MDSHGRKRGYGGWDGDCGAEYMERMGLHGDWGGGGDDAERGLGDELIGEQNEAGKSKAEGWEENEHGAI